MSTKNVLAILKYPLWFIISGWIFNNFNPWIGIILLLGGCYYFFKSDGIITE